MTLLVLTPTFDGRDGLSCLSRDLVATLDEACPGASLEVLSLAGGPVVPDRVAMVRGCGGSRPALAARVVAATAFRPAAVIVLHAHLLPLAWPALALGIPLVHVLVGIEAWRPFGPLARQALARAHAVLAISAHTRDRFRAANPLLASRAVHVCHPSAPGLPPPATDEALPAPGFALMVGRMAAAERYKGHDVVLDAWPTVGAARPGARLVVVGGGDDVPRLRERAQREGLTDSVTFLGQVGDEVLSACYHRAALLVMPSADEGFGYVFLEAMTAGLPCIAAPGAAEEIIEDGVTGLIVDRGNAGGVAAAVLRLLGDPEQARAMGRAGQARARTRFTRARFASDLRAALAAVTAC